MNKLTPISDTLREAYKQFPELDIYGTDHEPLFVFSQIQAIVKVYEPHEVDILHRGKDLVIVKTQNGDVSMLTERGVLLINKLSKLSSFFEFEKYILDTLKEIRDRVKLEMQNLNAKVGILRVENLIANRIYYEQKDKRLDTLKSIRKRWQSTTSPPSWRTIIADLDYVIDTVKRDEQPYKKPREN